MQVGLANKGPLSICVDAGKPFSCSFCAVPILDKKSPSAASWQYYESGVITSLCGTTLDHCVMYVGHHAVRNLGPHRPFFNRATGYSVQKGWDTFDYQVWNIRNSWGADWGYGGYLYVARGNNVCGVAELVTLPTV